MSALDRELPFEIAAAASFFEKASADAGKRRRVAGVISAEDEDQDGETVLQDGIDFSYFLEKGYFNDNHKRGIEGIVGYPESVERYRRGQPLPDGTLAKAACTWAEGYLLEGDPAADSIWQKGLALLGTPRALRFSIEGKSRARSVDGKTVIKSLVRHCAITHQPVHDGTRAHLFLKAIAEAERAPPEQLEAAWTAFAKALHGARAVAPRRRLSAAEAIALVRTRYPGIRIEMAERVVNLITARRRTR